MSQTHHFDVLVALDRLHEKVCIEYIHKDDKLRKLRETDAS